MSANNYPAAFKIPARTHAVSHLMPVRNGSKDLGISLPSLLSNTAVGDEVVLVDDGSTDSTPQLLADLVQQYPQVKVVTTKGLGLVGALNLGVANCSFEWIARYDVDDDWDTERVSEQINCITPKSVVIFSDYNFFLDGKDYAGWIPSPIFPLATLLSLPSSQQTAHPSALIRRDALLKVGGYLDADTPAEDLGLWLRISREGDLISVPQTLLHYNLSRGSYSAVKREQILIRKSEMIRGYGLVFSNYTNFRSQVFTEFNSYKQYSQTFIRRILFIRNLRNSVKLYPGILKSWEIIYLTIKTLSRVDIIALTKFIYFTMKRRAFRNFQ